MESPSGILLEEICVGVFGQTFAPIARMFGLMREGWMLGRDSTKNFNVKIYFNSFSKSPSVQHCQGHSGVYSTSGLI